MKIFSTYSVKVKHYNPIVEKTAKLYQAAVDFYISVCLQEWDTIIEIQGSKSRQTFLEQMTHKYRSKNKW